MAFCGVTSSFMCCRRPLGQALIFPYTLSLEKDTGRAAQDAEEGFDPYEEDSPPSLVYILRRAARRFVAFAADVIYDKAQGRGARLFGAFLLVLSYPYAGIARAKLWLYRNRLFRDAHLGCMVIVVGNLTMGGTGKTPVVERLARVLQARGRKVGILSRGYKSRKEPLLHKAWRELTHKDAAPPKVVSDGKSVLLGSLEAGDEPYMLAKNLPGVCVVVDKDRVKAGHYAVKHFGVDTLILDDGFQYYRLKDHLQVLLIDKNNPFGNGRLIPRGILREPVEHLRRASYIFLTKSDGVPDPALEARINAIRPGTELIECTHRPQYLCELSGGERLTLSFLKGRRVACLSAIAVPEGFEKFVAEQGAFIVCRSRFLDHHRFDADDLAEVFDDALEAHAEFMVTTEKDAVRMNPAMRCPMPIYYLRVEIEILSGAADFDEAVSRICRE